MSEAERKKRLSYKVKRKRWIFVQGFALALVLLLIFASLVRFDQLNKEYYIEYSESSSVDYRVKISKTAPFYSDYLSEFAQYADENGDLWIPRDYAYPTMAAEVIRIDLQYNLDMNTPNVDYEYTYRISAQPEVVDTGSKNKFPMPKTVIEEVTEPITQSSNNSLGIKRSIEVDYNYYNNIVKEFEDKLSIVKATENLIITMEVEVLGSSESFESNAENTHVITVTMPLNENAFDVNYSSSVPQGSDSKILARKNAGNQQMYKYLAIGLSALEAVLLIVLVAYVYLTRNHDVNYSIRVQRLVNNYRAFIQQVTNGFDATGYQILKIATFQEMLAIRDTIQSPILMSENLDQTKTQFFIPTNTKILYLYEIKIDNYDELYGAHPEWTDNSLLSTASAPVANVKSVPATTTLKEQIVNSKPNGDCIEIIIYRRKLKK